MCLKAYKNKLYHLGIKQNVNQSTLSRANENRDWRIFADFGEFLIQQVGPLYANCPIPNIATDKDVFALNSTTISLSLKLFSWSQRKYYRGAVKVHTLIDLTGSIPTFIFITDGKYHDSNILDVIVPLPDAIFLMDKAYVKYSLKSNLSIYETMQILGISAFDKTSIKELLTEIQVNQDFKEQYDLFNNQF